MKEEGKPKLKNDTNKEFLEMWDILLDSFKKILKDPNSSQKLYALRSFQQIQDMMKSKLADFTEGNQLDFGNLDKLFKDSKGMEGEEYKKIMSKILDTKKELESLFKDAQEEFGDKNKQKAKIKNKLKGIG